MEYFHSKTSFEDGHVVCAQVFEISDKILDISGTAANRIRSEKDGYAHEKEIELYLVGERIRVSCKYNGELGPWVIVIGERYQSQDGKTLVFFVGKGNDCCWCKVGQGECNIEREKLLKFGPFRHLSIGRSNGCINLSQCTCNRHCIVA